MYVLNTQTFLYIQFISSTCSCYRFPDNIIVPIEERKDTLGCFFLVFTSSTRLILACIMAQSNWWEQTGNEAMPEVRQAAYSSREETCVFLGRGGGGGYQLADISLSSGRTSLVFPSPGPGIIKALNAPTSSRKKKRGEIAGGA